MSHNESEITVSQWHKALMARVSDKGTRGVIHQNQGTIDTGTYESSNTRRSRSVQAQAHLEPSATSLITWVSSSAIHEGLLLLAVFFGVLAGDRGTVEGETVTIPLITGATVTRGPRLPPPPPPPGANPSQRDDVAAAECHGCQKPQQVRRRQGDFGDDRGDNNYDEATPTLTTAATRQRRPRPQRRRR
ncbi:hypothetical protein EDB85DRAFT_1895173 [Lactarius pseudohatsudake]|nr:hypothetical protein EDB85DRAFT_1895173 [Lactarius pseudohatsudake]